VVFLHGLGDNEHRWTEPRVSPCVDAVREMGWTPVLIRLNTGLSLGENGARLAQLLSDLVRAWPVPPQRIALVGHSMGGLVARSAAHAGRDLAPCWVDLLTDVVMVGTPHLGADLARVAAGGRCALAVLPETSPWGRVVDRRSAGIKDLAVGLPGLRPLPGVRYRLVSGQLDRPWGLLLGDLYVRRSSATGRRRRATLFPGADHLHLDSTSHLGLLRHPHLPQQLESWLR
jgi:pimeloyl-ACP methyl ester carboxylesterase